MLTSAKNPKVVAAVRLKKRALREEDRRFLVEGAQAVAEALAEDGRLLSLFVQDDLDPLAVRARQAGVAVDAVTRPVMERLTSTVTPQGVVGVAPFVDVALDDLAPPGAVAVLHEVRDPGNAGTILRSADAAGAAGVVFAGSSVDAYNPKTRPRVRGLDLPRAGHAGRRRRRTRSRHSGARASPSSRWTCTARTICSRWSSLGRRRSCSATRRTACPATILEAADRRVRVPQAGRAESL